MSRRREPEDLDLSPPLDFIGDVHGHARSLVGLLETLGYDKQRGTYQHRKSRCVFLGDLIDTGPRQRETLDIVRGMVSTGAATAILGNHEFNALLYGTAGRDGRPFRARTEANTRQHERFLAEYPLGSDEHRSALEWMAGLPLFLESPRVRAVHACWDDWAARTVVDVFGGPFLDLRQLRSSAKSDVRRAVDLLLKGRELALPGGRSFADRSGKRRRAVRVRWWGPQPVHLRDAFVGTAKDRKIVPKVPISSRWVGYGQAQVPVFVGHYALSGPPRIFAPNVGVLDWGVVRHGGRLTAYRWEGEARLRRSNLVSVARRE